MSGLTSTIGSTDESMYLAHHIMKRKRMLALYYLHIRKRGQSIKEPRKFWARPIFTVDARRKQGDHDNLIMEMRLNDPFKHFNYLRMSSEKFDELLSLIGPLIKKSDEVRESISASARLALTLRYLASGDSMVSMSYAFRIGKSTVSGIISETCEAIWSVLNISVLLNEPSEEKWLQLAEEFNQMWNFPNCIGAIDGKHVNIQAVPHSGSSFYNYKGQHSLVLMATCDANYRFTLVDIGAQGRQSDGGVFRNSNIGKAFEENLLSIPRASTISQSRNPIPYCMVADEAFALTNYMMRPYPRKNLNLAKRVFNYRLSRARRIIENCFGIYVARWRIFRKPFIASLETSERIVKATVCLHNWLMNQDSRQKYCPPRFTDYELPDGELVNGAWREIVAGDTAVTSIPHTGSNTFTRNAGQIRDELAEYFIAEGSVEWQYSKI